MTREQRIEQIQAEMSRLKNELSVLRHNTLNYKKLVYPAVNDYKRRIEERYICPTGFLEAIRITLTPEYREQKTGYWWTYPKHVKDLDEREYETVCNCINDCVEVINKYAEELHPEGIAWGEVYNGSFYKESKDVEEVKEESCTQ